MAVAVPGSDDGSPRLPEHDAVPAATQTPKNAALAALDVLSME
jgi:hypothetical protein